MNKDFNFDEWKGKYKNKEIVNLMKFLDKKDFEILNKLGIDVKNKIYTEQEFELLNMDLLMYYKKDGTDEKNLKKLEDTGVSREEYNKIIKKIDKINKKYNF